MDALPAGTDIKVFLEAQLEVVRCFIEESRDPSDEEWAALNDAMAAELIKLSNQANSA
jgi:hypothetical protein